MSPSTISSSLPVTVTVWASLQFNGVNVKVVGLNVSLSVRSSLVSVMVTSSVGSVSKTIVNVAVSPSSEVSLLIVETVTPAISLSKLVALTSAGSTFS